MGAVPLTAATLAPTVDPTTMAASGTPNLGYVPRPVGGQCGNP